VLSSSGNGRPFGHSRHGQKIGGVSLFGGPESPSNTMSPGPIRPISVPRGIFAHPAVWPQQAWAENWGLCPLGVGASSNTMWSGPRPIFVPSGFLIDPVVWPQHTWTKSGGGLLCPFLGELRPRLIQCGQVRGLYLHTKFHLDQSSRLATMDMGGKLGVCALFRGELGPRLTQSGRGRGIPPC